MKNFTKTLSMIVIFQLLVSCNEYGASSLAKTLNQPEQNELEISGIITMIMDSVIPTAAAETGTLYLYDNSDPEDIKEIYSEEINDKVFRFKLPASEINGKLIKFKYINQTDPSDVKEILIDSVDLAKSIVVQINDETSLSSVIKTQELLDLKQSAVDQLKLKTYFRSLEMGNYTEAVEILSKEITIKLLKNPEIGPKVAYLLIEHSRTIDTQKQQEIQEALFSIASDLGLIKNSLKLNCDSPIQVSGTTSGEEYSIIFHPDNKDSEARFGSFEFGQSSTPGQINETLMEIQKKFVDVEKNENLNLAGHFSLIINGEEVSSCSLGEEATGVQLNCHDNGYMKLAGESDLKLKVVFENYSYAEDKEEEVRELSLSESQKLLDDYATKLFEMSKNDGEDFYGQVTILHEGKSSGSCLIGQIPRQSRKMICEQPATFQNIDGETGLTLSFESQDEKTLGVYGSSELGPVKQVKKANAISMKLLDSLQNTSNTSGAALSGYIVLRQDGKAISSCEVSTTPNIK